MSAPVSHVLRVTPDLSMYPPVLRKAHMAAIFGCTVRCIEQQLARGAFPIPRLTHLPKPAWSKAVVHRFFEAQTFDAPARRSA